MTDDETKFPCQSAKLLTVALALLGTRELDERPGVHHSAIGEAWKHSDVMTFFINDKQTSVCLFASECVLINGPGPYDKALIWGVFNLRQTDDQRDHACCGKSSSVTHTHSLCMIP